ncbi:MAG: NADH-quinone oxidoreductase subunit H [Verrucomicrobiae bacterium]|nr:NADH-quinone oxidoreductase subunit H [Verrucomicrobiae bacterium]
MDAGLLSFLIFSAVKIGVVFGAVMTMFAYAVLAERKISAAIQDRVGPNRVSFPLIGSIPVIGPFLTRLGIWQPLVDGVKAFTKEDYTPEHVRKGWFWLAPMVAMVPSVLVLAVIPFGSSMDFGKVFGLDFGRQAMVIADLNVGILYTFGIVSLSVYGIVLAGYASNSKFPFLGGIRASAQMISYEIAMGMSVVPVFMIIGELNLSDIIAYQAENGWLAFPLFASKMNTDAFVLLPCMVVSFLIFTVSAFAETNRLPFDLPEAETELVSGYNTEYGSMKFAFFFMGEYIAMIAGSAMIVVLFFGGWTLPFWGLDQTADTLVKGVLQILIFVGKLSVFLGMMIWVRWMLPRFRYDQLMDLGWRRILPLALANIVLTAVLIYWNHAS